MKQNLKNLKNLTNLPELPFNETSGHSGSDTSKSRARDADSSGQTGKIQKSVLLFAYMQNTEGITWRDVAKELNLHHGSASGVLSVLHKTGHLVRLQDARGRCKIYVLPDYVNNRKTEEFGRKKCCPHCGGNL